MGDPRLAEKVKAAKEAKAASAQRELEEQHRKAVGLEQLRAWLTEVDHLQLLPNFHREGFHSLSDVRNADLSQEDLALLGFDDPATQQMVLETLAMNYAELGRRCAQQIAMGLAKVGPKQSNVAETGLFSMGSGGRRLGSRHPGRAASP